MPEVTISRPIIISENEPIKGKVISVISVGESGVVWTGVLHEPLEITIVCYSRNLI